MTLGSLFDGSGGFPLAASLCGITPIWASEVESFPIAVTSKRFPNMEHLGDITKLDGAKIQPVDIITFGSPCTRLSVAGKHDGFDIIFQCYADGEEDAHFTKKVRATDKYKYEYRIRCPVCGKELIETNESALFFHAIRIIKEMRDATNDKYPTFIIWENVPGAFSSNKGQDFNTVLKEIAAVAGYEDELYRPYRGWTNAGAVMGGAFSLAWRVLDAQYWGVPQRRRRIFLVADFGGERAGKVLFERDGLQGDFTPGQGAWERAAASFGTGIEKPICVATQQGDAEIAVDLCPTITAAAGTSGNNQPYICLNDQGGSMIDVSYDQAATLRAQEHGHQPSVCVSGFKYKPSAQSRSIGYEDEKSPTLSTNNDVAFCTHPKVVGTLCGSGAGTSRPAGNCNKVDLAICIAGNIIDREVKNGGNGLGALTDTSYTLNTMDKHAVCSFDLTQVTSPINRSQPDFGKPCHTLSASADAPGVVIAQDSKKDAGLLSGNKVTGTPMANCATKQFLGNQEAFSGEYFIKSNSKVRRLMPVECGRLQGFPDWWCCDVPHSDAAEYKMWGNGVALPCVLYVMQGILLCA